MCPRRSSRTFPSAAHRTPEDPTLTPLRILLLALLAGLLLTPAREPRGDVVDADAAAPPPRNVRAWVRRSPAPPTARDLDRLAARALTAPLWAARPVGPFVVARPPERPVAGRNAAVDWRLDRGRPGDTVTVRLLDPGGVVDSARITLDGAGTAAGAFRVRPPEPGWHAWRVVAAGSGVAAGAWVAPADTLHVLVATGAGSVEGREVARALERAGMRVTLGTDLGRGRSPGSAPPGLPEGDGLRAYDVVLVLAGAPVEAASGAALRAFVRQGGGLLLAGAAAAHLGSTTEPIAGDAAGGLRWSAPAEIEPLAGLPGSAAVAVTGSATLHPAAWSGDAVVLGLGVDGRGRVAALGLLETWRASLEAGRADALGAFWGSVAGWLAGGARAPVSIRVDPASAAPGTPIDVRLGVLDATAPLPERLVLVRPDAAADTLPIVWTGDAGAARFLAGGPGLHSVRLPGGPVMAAHLADPDAPAAPDAWARLADIAQASGGGLVPAESLDARAGGAPRPFPVRAALALLIALVACTEWTLRRLRGRA